MVSLSAILRKWGPIGHGSFGLLVIFEGSSTEPLTEADDRQVQMAVGDMSVGSNPSSIGCLSLAALLRHLTIKRAEKRGFSPFLHRSGKAARIRHIEGTGKNTTSLYGLNSLFLMPPPLDENCSMMSRLLISGSKAPQGGISRCNNVCSVIIVHK